MDCAIHWSSGNSPVIGTYLGTNLKQLSMIGGDETPVRAGEQINVLIDGAFGSGGLLRLGWALLPPPPNDDYSNASPIQGTSCSLASSVRTATGEQAGDRLRYDFRNIWWRWTAPGSGPVIVTNTLDSFATFAIYTGATVADKQLVTSNWLQDRRGLEFDAIGGTTYHIEATWGVDGDEVALQLTQHLEHPVLASGAGSIIDGFRFSVYGQPGSRYRIEYSTNLVDWHHFREGILSVAREDIVDPDIAGSQMRFYRLTQE